MFEQLEGLVPLCATSTCPGCLLIWLHSAKDTVVLFSCLQPALSVLVLLAQRKVTRWLSSHPFPSPGTERGKHHIHHNHWGHLHRSDSSLSPLCPTPLSPARPEQGQGCSRQRSALQELPYCREEGRGGHGRALETLLGEVVGGGGEGREEQRALV